MSVFSVNIGGKLVDLSSPCVMTIINVTPDSFYAGSRITDDDQLIGSVGRALEDGAGLLDIGGYSSRPGATDISPEEEGDRVCRALESIREHFGYFPISVDTFRSEVVERVLETWGPFLVNDITAGEGDPRMIPVVAANGLPYVAMHMRGTPQTMTGLTQYGDVVDEVLDYFVRKLAELDAAGVHEVIADVGFGFAKTVEQNFELLRRLDEFSVLGVPILSGISRKSMIWKPLGITPAEALAGTTALNWELLRKGTHIIRVHDTAEAVQTVRLFECYRTKEA